jgi:hypothetical protein
MSADRFADEAPRTHERGTIVPPSATTTVRCRGTCVPMSPVEAGRAGVPPRMP